MEQYKADFLEVLKGCFNFEGTLNRTKFWTFSIILSLALFIVNFCLGAVGGIIHSNVISIVIYIISSVLGFAVWAANLGPSIRRLRDAGFNPWLYLVVLVPCIGIIGLIVLLCLPSKNGAAVPAQPSAEN
mgnify:CR=1 FL=1